MHPKVILGAWLLICPEDHKDVQDMSYKRLQEVYV